MDWVKLVREQTTVVQSTLNQTLHDVSTSELTLTKGLHEILKLINDGKRKIENRYALTALLLTLNDHATRVREVIEEVRYVYDAVIQVCLHWRNGII